MSMSYRPCAVIPVFRHGKPLFAVVERILANQLPVIVIDDGNDAETKRDIASVTAAFPRVVLVTMAVNQGKGAAVIQGMLKAFALGYTHAFQIDADGQHDLGQIDTFIEISRKESDCLVCGYPEYDESAPSSRKNGRKITNFWVAIETLSFDIRDAMCGFRVYPLASTCRLVSSRRIGRRMTFDIDILVKLHRRGVRMVFSPIKVIYPESGVSNFRMVKDNVAISAMHTGLFFGMLLLLPVLLARKAGFYGK